MLKTRGGRSFNERTIHAVWTLMLVFASAVPAQDVSDDSELLPPPSVAEKWDLFEAETASTFTLGAGAFNATVSQVTHSTPLYGRDLWPAYGQRLGASVADIATQNFFSDFLLASALHEDTRYRRLGSSHRLWSRVGYAVTRSFVARTDSGGAEFNWANVGGTGMSAALSNAYYPAGSRSVRTSATNWGVSLVGSGLVNLMPEFWPDVSHWMKRIVLGHDETRRRRNSL